MANPLIETVREALSELSPENPWTFDDALSALARIEALLAETEARAVRAEAALRDVLDVAERIRGGDPSLDPEEWYARRDFARAVLAGQEGKPE